MPWPRRRPDPRPADGNRALTDRDRQLLRHLAEGRSTAQIAAAMSVTSNAARTRIRRVQDKLAVSGRRHLVDAARRSGVL
ncbi:response regulator transcription factor [Geodermatophilus sp. SYSU D00697]